MGSRAAASVPDVIAEAAWVCEAAAAPSVASVIPRFVRASAAVAAPVPPLATGTAPVVFPSPMALRKLVRGRLPCTPVGYRNRAGCIPKAQSIADARRCRLPGTALGDRKRRIQQKRPTKRGFPSFFGHLAESDPAAIIIEIHQHLFGANTDRLLHCAEPVRDPDHDIVAVQRIKGRG